MRPLLLIALLLVHLLLIVMSQVLALFPSKAPYTNGHFAGFALLVCQAGLAASWALLAPWPAWRRSLAAAALCVGVWSAYTVCLAVGSTAARERFPVAAASVAVVLLASFCLSLVVLRAMQFLAGWRLAAATPPTIAENEAPRTHLAPASRHSPGQFRIVELWASTAVAALLTWCAVAAYSRTSAELNVGYVGSFGLVIVWQAIQLPLAIGIVFRAASLLDALLRLGLMLIVTLGAARFSMDVGQLISDLPPQSFAAAAAVFAVVPCASLFVLRWAGLQLEGRPRRRRIRLPGPFRIWL
ncbi:MAG: hypothetical protein RIC55_27835 [Pirellulaceae bacterium]